MKNTLQNNSKTVANKAAVTKLQKRMAKVLLSFCILFSMLMGINMMGYAQSSSQPVTQKTCSIAKGGAAVNFTVAGQLPDNARVSATSVSRTLPNGKQVMGAYDITITKGRSTWQPANGQPVQVTISDPDFADGTPLSVYHEGANGLEFVANVTATNHTITFPAQSFSVYIVGQETENARLKVNFVKSDGTESLYVKQADLVTDDVFEQVVYDPGAGTLGANVQFRGWTTNANYTADDISTGKTIQGVRDSIRTMLTDGVTEGQEITFYAMLMKSYVVTYLDDRESTLGQHEVTFRADETVTARPYEVNMAYTPSDVSHNFEGWKVSSGSSNIAGYTADTAYANESVIQISGDVVFSVNAPEGHWLVFNENGKGATYNAPQFVKSGQLTVKPLLAQDENMIRNGYTFGGWYTDAACTAGNEFTFGGTITDRTEIYAKWIPKTTAGYTVLIWKENLAGDGYDYVDHVSLTGTVGSTINTVTQVNSGNSAYARINGVNYNTYTGFHLKEFDTPVTISIEGNSVVNVYYERTTYTLTFRRYENPGAVYKTITAKYGHYIGNNFPISANGSTDYRWEPVTPNDAGYTEVLVYIDIMPAANVTFTRNSSSASTKYMEFWVEALPGQTGTRTFDGKSFVKYGNTIPAKYSWFTIDVDFPELTGYNKFGSDPAFDASGEAHVSGGGTLYLYYTRKAYPINYMDGIYVDGNGNPITSEANRGQLGTVANVVYQSNMSSYNKGGADYYEPTYQGYVHEGWYLDANCTQPYTFTTMPEGGITLYAKWRIIQYRVFLHPEAGHDLSLDWGTDNQSMAFRIDYGKKVSAPHGYS